MSNFTDTYEVTSNVTETGIQFFFMSEGKNDIIKFISYSYLMDFKGSPLYNLALLDVNPFTDVMYDDRATNNGDTYRVFHTVLATIPHFFSTYGDALLMVQGSDSTREFKDKCRLSCKKRCLSPACRNAHRRINIYRSYVDRNFDNLNKEYMFFGDLGIDENQTLTEDYVKGEKYIKVLLKKRKFEYEHQRK